MPSTTPGQPLTPPFRLPVLALLLSGSFALGADSPAGPRTDLQFDPLPAEAVARMGSGRLRHGGSVRVLAFSPDGKSLVSGGRGGLRVWDTATGKLRCRIPLEADGGIAVRVTDAGIRVAHAGETTGPVTVQLFDTEGKARSRIELPDRSGGGLTFSPDGGRLAYSRRNGVWVYDAATGRAAVHTRILGSSALALAFAPDGKALAVGDFNDVVRLCDAATGKELRTLRRPGHLVCCVAYSPDGRRLVSIPAISPDGTGACTMWDVATGKELHRFKAPGGFVESAAFSPDGKYLVMGCMHPELVLLDVTSGKEARRWPAPGYIWGVDFSPDGKTVAVASQDHGSIRLWDLATGRLLPGSADLAIDRVTDLHFSPDGNRLFGSAAVPIAWQPLSGREAHRYPVPRASSALAFSNLSPDRTLIATADQPDVRLSDARTGREVRALKGHEGWISAIVFLPGGRLACGGGGATIPVWDVASGRLLHKLTSGGHSHHLAVSPDGRRLASAAEPFRPVDDRAVILWDLGAGREQARQPEAWESGALGLTFSRDGHLLAAVGHGLGPDGPGAIQVWDVATCKEWRSFAGHKTGEGSVAFSPDRRTLVTGGCAGSLCLWELASGRRRHAFVGHEGEVVSVTFSPDGRLLAASSADAPVYVWDVTGAYGPKRAAPAAAELGRCWDELAGADAEVAFRAVRRLASAPSALPFLRGRLKPVAAVPPERLRRLLADLDGADFAARRRAAAELEQVADAAAPELRKELEKAPSAEARRAIKRALDGLATPTPERLRVIRAAEALEWMGTPDAARLLDELTRGAPAATLTTEAAAARERLRKAASTRRER